MLLYEADDFVSGTDISTEFDDIVLLENGFDPVYAVTSTKAAGKLGTNSIGHAGGELWNFDRFLVIAFNGNAKSVSLDVIADSDSSYYITAYLEAYDWQGTLIDSYEDTRIYKLYTYNLSINRDNYDVAYFVVYTDAPWENMAIDNIQIDFSPVHEQTTDFDSIQDAIDCGRFGDPEDDEIIVYPGVYKERINFYGLPDYFNGKITIKSLDPQDPQIVADTIIDAMGAGVGVRFDTFEDVDAVLDGLTIQNGYNGIYCYWSSPLITNCVIKNNNSAGIFCELGSNPVIIDCIIENNDGVGIDCLAVSDPIIRNSVIQQNNADGISGIYLYGEVSNCTIRDNAGNGIKNCLGIVKNCIVSGNLQNGLDRCSGQILNCTIVGNKGHGVTSVAGADVEFINNIIVYNSLSGVYSGAKTQILFFNNIWGNLDGSYNDGIEPGDYDIHRNPFFAVDGYWESGVWVDDQADYHLRSKTGRWDEELNAWVIDDTSQCGPVDCNSPCINAGDPDMSIEYEPNPNGGRINMGAYGGTEQASKSTTDGPDPRSVCLKDILGDLNKDCKVDFMDLAIIAENWLKCNLGRQEACWE